MSLFELDELLSKLPKDNRRVVLGDRLPWKVIEQEYYKRLSHERCDVGNKPARIVVGTLIIVTIRTPPTCKQQKNLSGYS